MCTSSPPRWLHLLERLVPSISSLSIYPENSDINHPISIQFRFSFVWSSSLAKFRSNSNFEQRSSQRCPLLQRWSFNSSVEPKILQASAFFGHPLDTHYLLSYRRALHYLTKSASEYPHQSNWGKSNPLQTAVLAPAMFICSVFDSINLI